MAIIKLNNNALTSVTALPSGVGSDPDVKTDLSRLGLRVFANQNLAKQNSNSASYDVFQDSTGVTNLVNCTRSSGEYVSSSNIVTNYGLPMGSFNSQIDTGNGGWTGSITNDELTANGASYIGGYFDVLFDLSQDFLVKGFFTDNSGSQIYKAYGLYTALVTTDTSISAGVNPTIFNDQTTTNYPHPNLSPTHVSNWLTSSYYSTIGVSGITDNYNNGSGTSVQTVNCGSDTTIHARGYAGNYNRWGMKAVYNKAANTISINFGSDASLSATDRGATQFTNVPSTGRFMMTFGHDTNASDRVSGTFNSSDNTNFGSYVTGSSNATGSFEGATITAGSSTSKMGAVITYIDQAGTNALNSDLVLKLSADNGSNYSTATLTALPDFASGVKCCQVSDLSVTAGTQLKYKIEFANQSSGSKECRVTGVSLQY